MTNAGPSHAGRRPPAPDRARRGRSGHPLGARAGRGAAGRDINWLPREKHFVLGMNRFVWEAAPSGSWRKREYQRRRSALHFARVEKVQSLGIDREAATTVLELLAVRFEPGDAPSGDVVLDFAGGATIRLCGGSAGGGADRPRARPGRRRSRRATPSPDRNGDPARHGRAAVRSALRGAARGEARGRRGRRGERRAPSSTTCARAATRRSSPTREKFDRAR